MRQGSRSQKGEKRAEPGGGGGVRPRGRWIQSRPRKSMETRVWTNEGYTQEKKGRLRWSMFSKTGGGGGTKERVGGMPRRERIHTAP